MSTSAVPGWELPCDVGVFSAACPQCSRGGYSGFGADKLNSAQCLAHLFGRRPNANAKPSCGGLPVSNEVCRVIPVEAVVLLKPEFHREDVVKRMPFFRRDEERLVCIAALLSPAHAILTPPPETFDQQTDDRTQKQSRNGVHTA